MSPAMKLAQKILSKPGLELATEHEYLLATRIDDLEKALGEAIEWIERPVETQEDAVMFLMFEERAKELLS